MACLGKAAQNESSLHIFCSGQRSVKKEANSMEIRDWHRVVITVLRGSGTAEGTVETTKLDRYTYSKLAVLFLGLTPEKKGCLSTKGIYKNFHQR